MPSLLARRKREYVCVSRKSIIIIKGFTKETMLKSKVDAASLFEIVALGGDGGASEENERANNRLHAGSATLRRYTKPSEVEEGSVCLSGRRRP